MKIEEIKGKISEYKEVIKEKYKIKEIGIFGSYARGEENKSSDIDIYIEFEEPIGWEFVDLKEELENLLGRRVDILTKDALIRKPILWESIKKDIVYV